MNLITPPAWPDFVLQNQPIQMTNLSEHLHQSWPLLRISTMYVLGFLFVHIFGCLPMGARLRHSNQGTHGCFLHTTHLMIVEGLFQRQPRHGGWSVVYDIWQDLWKKLNTKYTQWLFLVPVKGGRRHIIPQLAVYTTYILPSGGLYATDPTFYGNQQQPLINGWNPLLNEGGWFRAHVPFQIGELLWKQPWKKGPVSYPCILRHQQKLMDKMGYETIYYFT